MKTNDNPRKRKKNQSNQSYKGKSINDVKRESALNNAKNRGYRLVTDSLNFGGVSPLNPYAEGYYSYKNDTTLWNAYKEGMKKAKQDFLWIQPISKRKAENSV